MSPAAYGVDWDVIGALLVLAALLLFPGRRGAQPHEHVHRR